jgi:hypothetical protein
MIHEAGAWGREVSQRKAKIRVSSCVLVDSLNFELTYVITNEVYSWMDFLI